MPEDDADLRQGGVLREHVGGQAMAKQVGASVTHRTGVAEILSHRRPDVDVHLICATALAFPPHCDQARFPVDVVQGQGHDFAGAKPQPC
jgi:hypothetical protein